MGDSFPLLNEPWLVRWTQYLELSTCDLITQDKCWYQVWGWLEDQEGKWGVPPGSPKEPSREPQQETGNMAVKAPHFVFFFIYFFILVDCTLGHSGTHWVDADLLQIWPVPLPGWGNFQTLWRRSACWGVGCFVCLRGCEVGPNHSAPPAPT